MTIKSLISRLRLSFGGRRIFSTVEIRPSCFPVNFMGWVHPYFFFMHPDVYFYVLGNPLIFYVLKSWVPMHKKVFLCIPMHKTYFFEISAREGREIFHVLRWNSLNKMRVHGSKRM